MTPHTKVDLLAPLARASAAIARLDQMLSSRDLAPHILARIQTDEVLQSCAREGYLVHEDLYFLSVSSLGAVADADVRASIALVHGLQLADSCTAGKKGLPKVDDVFQTYEIAGRVEGELTDIDPLRDDDALLENWLSPEGHDDVWQPGELRGDLPPEMVLADLFIRFHSLAPFGRQAPRMARLLVPVLARSLGLTRHAVLGLSAGLRMEGGYCSHFSNNQVANRALVLDAMAIGAERARQIAVALRNMERDFLDRLEPRRSTSHIPQAIRAILGRPVFTPAWLSRELGISHVGTESMISRLDDAGLLREITGRRVNRVFSCDRALNLMAG